MDNCYQILIKTLIGSSILLKLSEEELVRFATLLVHDKRPSLLPNNCRFLNSCGREVSEGYLRTGIQHPCIVFINGTLLGGKGGFGANLRRQGGRMRAKKTTNFDACRDLSGRRLKTLKNSQHIAEYITYADQRRQEEEEALQRKIMVGLQGPSKKPKIEDPNYVKESKEIVETVAESVEEGISAARRSKMRHINQKDGFNAAIKNGKRPLTIWGDDDFVDEDEDGATETARKDRAKPASASSSSSIKVA